MIGLEHHVTTDQRPEAHGPYAAPTSPRLCRSCPEDPKHTEGRYQYIGPQDDPWTGSDRLMDNLPDDEHAGRLEFDGVHVQLAAVGQFAAHQDLGADIPLERFVGSVQAR